MDNAHNQAIAQLDTITALVAAYNADFDRLAELRDEREDLATDAEQAAKDYDALAKDRVTATTVAKYADRLQVTMHLIREWDVENLDELQELQEQADGYECREDVEQAMQEHPLSLEYRSAWARALPGEELEPAEFRLVLCTGGPHVEITGDLDADRVRVLYSDWGESGELHSFDHDAVETYLNVIGVNAC